jgi:hypothetical protein
LPEKLNVMGVPFRVERADLDEDTVGDTVGLYRRIRVSPDINHKKAWSVLVHEWAHAVMYVNGVSSTVPEEVEEILAQSFEHAIEELLQQIGPALLDSYRD